jgi:2',3'-cyclic-nucleotide 2'-phosphodiesterase (5'-nucleotidase family)
LSFSVSCSDIGSRHAGPSETARTRSRRQSPRSQVRQTLAGGSFSALLLSLALGLLLAAGCAATPPCSERAPLRVQFLLVNDVYQLEPDTAGRGGLARVATLVRRLRQQSDHTLFVLAGDTLSPSPLSSLLRGRQMVETWNAIGLDVATFGNHEFDWGPTVLRERMAESRFRWVSSNVQERQTGQPFGGASRWLRLDWSGVRVGLVGLTTPDTAKTSMAGSDVSFEPPVTAMRAALDELGAVNLRVAVTHLPLSRDRELAVSAPLDLILGGHDHDPMVTDEGSTAIIKAGSDAVNVGRVEYELGCDAKALRRWLRLIPVDASLAEAPDVAALVARYAATLQRELATEVAQTRVVLDGREAIIRRQETLLGKFLARVMAERVGAEVSMLNSGALRGNRLFAPGTLTRRDVHELLPFANIIVLVELTGAALQAALEHSVDALPRPSGHFLQTHGLSYALDPSQPAGRRVSGIQVNGRPLDPQHLYRVALTDYLARGQDNFPMLAGGKVLIGPEDGPALLASVLEAFASGRSP